MSAAAVRRFKASVSTERSCEVCGASFTVRSGADSPIWCPSCVSTAVERRRAVRRANAERDEAARAEREAKRKAMHCDRCETRLLSAAALCGMCDPDWDAVAVLAAIDAERKEAA